jgi:Sec-independent protein translocase protein TatA
MADVAAPAPAAAEAPAPAATAINPSEAGRALRSLRDAVNERHAALDKADAPETPETKPEDREPTTKERVELLRAQREAAAAKKKLDGRAKDLDTREKDPLVGKGKLAAELASKGDMVGALNALGLTRKELFDGDKALFWQLSRLAEQAEGEAETPDPAKIAADVAKKAIEDAKKADQDAAEAERLARIDANDAAAQAHSKAIDDSVAARMKERIADLPHIADNRGIPPEWVSNWEYVGAKHKPTMDAGLKDLREGKETEAAGFVQRYVHAYTADYKRKEGREPSQAQIGQHMSRCVSPGYVEWFQEQNQRPPTPDEVLEHFEGFFKKQLDDKLGRLRPAAGAKPVVRELPKVPSKNLLKDVGHPSGEGRAKTMAEAVARAHAKLERG